MKYSPKIFGNNFKNLASLNYPKSNILVVDDNPVDRKLLSIMLKKKNGRIYFAANGFEAIEICRKHSLDLILMNLHMPKMDGFQASKEIRRLLSHNRHIPIIGITSNENDSERLKCLDAGMNDYYQKPFRMVYLDYILDDWLVREDISAFAVS